MTMQVNANDLRQRVRDLAAIPQVVHEVLAATRDAGISIDQVAARVGHDPALVARTLRVANSPFYGLAGRIGSIRDALRVVGMQRLGTVLMAAAVSGNFPPPACRGFEFKSFWGHSFAAAICAQALASACHLDEGAAFTAGLIHDIGRLVLATYYPHQLEAAIADAQRRDVAPLDGERAVLALDHCEIGAWVAEHWHFADVVVDSIRHHHEPPPRAAAAEPTLSDLIHVADGIAHALDLARQSDEMVPPMALESWTRLGLKPEAFLKVFAHTELAHAALCETLAI
jgi:putative nucleotidyltransferase with HDIG domain